MAAKWHAKRYAPKRVKGFLQTARSLFSIYMPVRDKEQLLMAVFCLDEG